MFAGKEYEATVDYLVERLGALCLGETKPRVVILEAESGSGKSRIVKEFYNAIRLNERFQPLSSTGDSYWPHLDTSLMFDDYSSPETIHRKSISPSHRSHIRPEESYPGFMWEAIRCDVLASQPSLHFGELLIPSFEAHLPYLAYSWQKKALSSEKFGRWVKSKFTKEVFKELEETSGIEALLKVLEMLEIPIFPGASYVIEKLGSAISHGVARHKLKKDIQSGGTLASQDYSAVLFEEITRLIRSDLPLVIAVEDIHLLTEEVSDFLLMLATLDASKPVLIIGTSWPEARNRPVFKKFKDALERSGNLEMISKASEFPFPELHIEDRVEIAREYAPKTAPDLLNFIAEKWSNPLAIKLIMSSDYATRRIKDDALVADKTQLSRMPIGVERIFEERWLSLDTSVRALLSICAGGIPNNLSRQGSTFPFVSSIITDVIDRLAKEHLEGLGSDTFAEVQKDALWIRRAFECLDSVEFREWFLQKLAREAFESDFDKSFEARMKKEVLRLLADRLATIYDNLEPFAIGTQDDQVASQWYVDLVDDLPPAEKFRIYKAGAKTYDRALELLADKAMRFMRFDTVLNLMEQRFRPGAEFDEDDVPYLSLYAGMCAEMGRFDRSIELLSWWLEHEKTHHGTSRDTYFGIRYNIARAKRMDNRLLEALTEFDDLLAETLELRPDNELLPLGPRHERAIILALMEDFQLAVGELESLVPEFIKHWGQEDGRTYVLLDDLENARANAGLTERSVKHEQDRLKEYEKLFGLDHRSTYERRTQLALALMNAGDNQSALEIQREVVSFYEERFPKSFPDALRARMRLGYIEVRTGNKESGLTRLVDLLEEAKQNAGEDHPLIASIAIEAASAAALGDDLALRGYLLHEVTEHISDEAIKSLPHLRKALEHFAIFLGSFGDPSCIPYFEQVLKALEQTSGPESEDYFRARLEFASSEVTMGRAESAKEVFQSALAAVDSGKYEWSSDLRDTIEIDLAKAEAELGNFSESVRILSGMLLENRSPSLSAANTNNAYSYLILSLESLDQIEKAYEISHSYATRLRQLGKTREESFMWARLHELENANPPASLDSYRSLLSRSYKHLGPQEKTSLLIQESYARRLGVRQGAKAAEELQSAFEKWASLTGPKSSGAVANRGYMAALYVDQGRWREAINLLDETLRDLPKKSVSPWIELKSLRLLLELADEHGVVDRVPEYRQRFETLSAEYEIR